MNDHLLWTPVRKILTVLTLVILLAPTQILRVEANLPTPTISATARSVRAGDVIRVTGSNFPGSLSGSLSWGPAGETVGMFGSSARGEWTTLVQVPDVAAGTYQLASTSGGLAQLTVRVESGTSALSAPKKHDPTKTAVDGGADQVNDTPTSVADTNTPIPQPTASPTDPPAPPATNTDTSVPPTATTPPDTATPGQAQEDPPTNTNTAALTATQPSDPVSINPVADAYVSQDQPSGNFGADTELHADALPQEKAYVAFTVSGVGSIATAKLRLYVTNETALPTELYGSDANWQESAVTWTNAPAPNTSKIGDLAPTAIGKWVETDVSSLVRGDGSFSFVVIDQHRDGSGFASRETDNAPQLIVTPGKPTTDSLATVTADTGTSTVSIDKPASGTSYLSDTTVAIAVSASSTVGVAKIELYDNDQLITTEDSAPFTYQWNVNDTQNGDHAWTAVVTDANGATTTSEAVTVTVAIGPSTFTEASGDVTAAGETAPVPHSGDAADDPAIWVNAADPSRSTVIGTDKLGGLAVYDLGGNQLFYYSDSTPNNVDVRYGFPLSTGPADIVVTSDTGPDTIRIYRIDPSTRGLEYIAARSITTNLGVAGICLYHSPSSGKTYVFIGDSSGNIQQWELKATSDGKVDATKVRTLSLSSVTEGMVADDLSGALYVSQEDVALWRYGAEPDAGSARTKVDDVDGTHLTADIEGLAIYYGGPGYLLVSSQGSSDYAVYRRDTNTYLGRFSVKDGTVDGTSHTDGIDVTNRGLGNTYGFGMFVTQDDSNPGGNQNFKMVPWDRIAKSFTNPLSIDTSVDVNIGGGSDPGPSPTSTPASTATPLTYYVDSASGSDSDTGTSSTHPWKSLAKVNGAQLSPGSRVLFRRGGSWTGSLKISSSGASGETIVIGVYGSGAAPIIQGGSSCVSLSGSYVVIQDLQLTGCSWAGVEVGGSHNRIRRNVISDNVSGIVIKSGATRNMIDNNVLTNNNKMSVLTQGGNDDSGAFGVLLQGDYTDVSYNTISGSDAFSYDYGRDGSAIEVYGGRHNQIHHNLARNNDTFTELGNSRSAYNTYSYNVVFSSYKTSVFLVTRGSGSGYGPVEYTTLYNNTVLLTGASSQGFVCSSGCGANILRMRNNIIQAVLKVGYADAAFDEDYDLFFGGQTQFKVGQHSRVASPKFVDAINWNVRLTSSSPAIDAGSRNTWTVDFAGAAVPSDGDGDGSARQDIGAYEY